MQKSMEKLNANAVGATSSRPLFEETPKNKGITLIALIITIVVMLILVGVTINVALNGGLFSKAEEATTKTKIAQIQDALLIKKAEVLAEHDGKTPADYGITIAKLNLPTELKTEYGNKLKISKVGILGYDASVVTDIEEQNLFKSMGIEEYVETNEGETYTFTIGELANRGMLAESGGTVSIPEEDFWPNYVSEELKNSKHTEYLGSEVLEVYNIYCPDLQYITIPEISEGLKPNSFAFYGGNFEGKRIIFLIVSDENGEIIGSENYTNYADLAFTISMPE